ncbi:hypothetical protein SUGI_0825210 [Cryptomeria japonica]|nr:hypothetical protein SUGI_0825210 [Cryptomeria japonica]
MRDKIFRDGDMTLFPVQSSMDIIQNIIMRFLGTGDNKRRPESTVHFRKKVKRRATTEKCYPWKTAFEKRIQFRLKKKTSKDKEDVRKGKAEWKYDRKEDRKGKIYVCGSLKYFENLCDSSEMERRGAKRI